MSTFKQLEDIIAWQKARTFCIELQADIKCIETAKDFELKNQLKAASGSVMDNIAEGFGRMGNLEFKNFLTIAHGSLMECLSQLYRSCDFQIITIERFNFLKGIINEISRLIRSLIQTLQASDLRGVKFK